MVDKKTVNLLDKKLTDKSFEQLEIKENYISDLTKNLDKQLSYKDMQISELTQTLREMNKSNRFLLAKDNPTLINQTQNNDMEVVVIPSESPLEQEETEASVVKQKVKKSIFNIFFKK